jgi:hypothetical protein
VRVKATKRTAGKFVCKAGTSAAVVIPAKYRKSTRSAE